MITKAKKLTFTSSDGEEWPTIEQCKSNELVLLTTSSDGEVSPEIVSAVKSALNVLVQKPREAIAILRFGLPRKPRTVKATKKKTASQRIREEIGAPLRAQ